MNRFSLMAAGLVLVVLDLRFEGLDVIPDPIGWVLAAVALVPLASLHVGLLVAALTSGVGVLASLPGVVDPDSVLTSVVEPVLETVLVFAVCTALHALSSDEVVRRMANRIRWADLALTVVLVGGAAALGESDPPDLAYFLVVPLVIAALAVFVWFLVVCVRAGRQPPFAPAGVTPAPSAG